MAILAVLIINGILFHLNQIPALGKHLDRNLAEDKKFMSKLSIPFFIGGAISGVSWTAAIVLGALPGVDLTVLEILQIYLAVAMIACVASLGIRAKLLQ